MSQFNSAARVEDDGKGEEGEREGMEAISCFTTEEIPSGK